ncbi:MAG TPA: hypothetical protein VFV50_04945 [Bdellovibrionales bacterium]|nr:hypothetical protein [Bdellovibrionales bacterium]
MNSLYAVVAALMLTISTHAAAQEFPAQARLFGSVTNVSPGSLNTELRSQGIKEFSQVSRLGVEITFHFANFLEVGLQYAKRNLENDETNATSATDYYSKIDQDLAMGIVRLPLLKTMIMRADVFAGIGGSNSQVNIAGPSQDGQLTKKDFKEFFASWYAAYGASFGIGYKNFFIYVEAGYESNKVDGFQRSGTISNSIQPLDLSGPYGTVGILFDGVTARKQ